MSKLSELIAALCPDGVEYKTLGEVADMRRGVRVVRRNLNEAGTYPVYQNSLTPMGHYEQKNFDGGKAFVICAGAAGEIGYSDVDFWAADDCFVLLCSTQINDRFLYHVLLSRQPYIVSKVRKASVPRLAHSVVEAMKIPVPPLEVQAEIVRILDNFAELTNELTEKLNAELIARKKQYEYYRDLLLTFDDAECPLGGKVSMCKRILKHETNTINGVPFYKIGTFGKEANAFISKKLFETYKTAFPYPQKGDILISAAGTIGKAVVFDGAPAYFQDSNIVWIANDESKVLNKFLYYIYKMQPWRASLGGTIARLYNDDIARTKIPVPPLSEQRRIVAILDRFDALCHDVCEGLPAEIAARKKQYAYYRDKLLTFKEKVA